MWPFHTWLPDAHVEAPTAGSVVLAGVLLKLGGYGFLRFSLPMLPEATAYFTPMIYTLSIVAVIYTSLVALMQTDMKKLIAYSSVAHMGIVTIGIFTLNPLGIQGSIIQMLSHGLVSAALFMCVGVVYDRIHSREIESYGGLVERMPAYAVVFMLFMLASVGLPGTSGFVGEILVLIGVFQVNQWVALFAATGMVLGAAYMLWLYRRVIFGGLTKDSLQVIRDLRPHEILSFAPLVVLVLLMGIYPSIFLEPMAASVDHLLNQAALPQTELAGRGDADRDHVRSRPRHVRDLSRLRRACAFDGRRLQGRGRGQQPPGLLARDHGAGGRPVPSGDGRQGAGRDLRRPVRDRRLRLLPQDPGADRRRPGAVHDPGLFAEGGDQPLRIQRARAVRDGRHADDDLGQQPDLALCRP
jgi:hypothetical protein